MHRTVQQLFDGMENAVADMPAPKDKTELQRALGVVNYMSISANTKAMCSLLAKKSEWQWEHHPAQESEKLRNSLIMEPVLK